MSTSLIPNQEAVFAPPLDMPLRLLGRAGLFGMNRTRVEREYTSSSGPAVPYTPHQMHTGLDLQAAEGDPVFAARGGQFVHMNEIRSNPDNRRMFIRHMEPGAQSFITRYLHVKSPKISVGDSVYQGQCIAEVGSLSNPHLHFEIRLIVNTASPNDWDNDNTEPLDPLPFLYRWEKIYYEQISRIMPSLGRRRALLVFAGVMRKDGVWMYEVKHDDEWYYIPLYCLDEGDKQLIKLLTDAYINRVAVRIATRESPFFKGRKIILQARIGGKV
jgi:hypothetical protein